MSFTDQQISNKTSSETTYLYNKKMMFNVIIFFYLKKYTYLQAVIVLLAKPTWINHAL